MKKDELIPYLNKFITVILKNTSEHTGYVSNAKEIIEAEEEDVVLKLINGMFTEEVPISEIESIELPERENTVSIPTIELTDGYKNN
ncbi:MAG: hypothetical protein IKE51_05375 [Solobacterium sp.]|nr:hypothetical protein [Solobacterium sp.]